VISAIFWQSLITATATVTFPLFVSVVIVGSAMPTQRKPAFERMEASLLACPRCKRAVPVRKRLLLVLPEGDKYEYLCPQCGSTCGTTVEAPPPLGRI
jgi:hypothetical protein